MSLFDKKPEVSRRELRDTLRKSDGKGKFKRDQRVKLESQAFPKKYGPMISSQDYKRALNDLRRQRFQTKDYTEKLKIDREIKLLEGLTKQS